jgi:hypothetical protein
MCFVWFWGQIKIKRLILMLPLISKRKKGLIYRPCPPACPSVVTQRQRIMICLAGVSPVKIDAVTVVYICVCVCIYIYIYTPNFHTYTSMSMYVKHGDLDVKPFTNCEFREKRCKESHTLLKSVNETLRLFSTFSSSLRNIWYRC